MSKSLQGVNLIDDLKLEGKCVFIRVDFNVPIVNGVITDDSRIKGAIPTIRKAMASGAKVVLGSHFGRPKEKRDWPKFSLEPVATRLQELTDYEVLLVEEPLSEAPIELVKTLRPNQIILLENLRFDPGETKNQTHLAEAISRYADVYINDAFGASHRGHASIVGLPSALKEKAMGYLMKREVEMLDTVLTSAEKPYWAILGGAKVSDKIQLIENLMDHVDGFVIGGAMAYTFLAAQGRPVGKSLVEKDQITFTKRLLERLKGRDKQIILPLDHVVATSIEAPASECKTVDVIEGDMMGFDIGPRTLKEISSALSDAKTIFWNGPMGVFEKEHFAGGTFELAKILSDSKAITIVGGGDSASAARKSGFAETFSHISTGGGASLEFLQGIPLPGLLALQGKWKSHMGDV